MHRRLLVLLALGALCLFSVEARAFTTASPQEVGLSTERLARIGQALTQQIEARSFPGAVALVMRRGCIAYFETFGQLDPQTGAPMAKDAIFRLYSMTKPFTSAAALDAR
jgi:CubicO group peptidase (beta-lactamase class C family)